jgi:hypothetical protein
MKAFPLAGVGGVKDGFDHFHVLDGVLEGDGNISVFQNSFREGIALQGELITDGKDFLGEASDPRR